MIMPAGGRPASLNSSKMYKPLPQNMRWLKLREF